MEFEKFKEEQKEFYKKFNREVRLKIFLRCTGGMYECQEKNNPEGEMIHKGTIAAIRELDGIEGTPTKEETSRYEKLYQNKADLESEMNWYERNKDTPYPEYLRRKTSKDISDNGLASCLARTNINTTLNQMREIERRYG